jgi:tRNA (cmo5U34)-methyltransferase
MTGPAAAAFSAHAPQYTALRRRLVPGYDAFYGTAVDVVRLAWPETEPIRVLDLGAGTGLLSTHLLTAFAAARIDLLDASGPMLDEARQRLGAAVTAVHVADMAKELPRGPYDAVVSALAIHHLDDAGKRLLFGRVREVLAPGGVFVNAEQLAAPTAELQEAYTARWVADCRALGATEAEIEDTRDRMRHDRCTDLESQLEWLRDAGFVSVDCFYKAWRFAVYAGFTEAR